MSYATIAQVFRQHIVDNSYFGLGSTAWQPSANVDFTNTAPKATFELFPTQSEVVELGVNVSEIISGYAQINLFYPSGEGDYNIFAKADAVKAAFKPQRLNSGDVSVRIQHSEVNNNPLINSGWFNLYIDIRFAVFYCNS